MNYNDLCQNVTASIIAAIETGDTGTWRAPWHQTGALWAPTNAKTGAHYRGGNIIALASSALNPHDSDQPWTSPHWATYKQWAALGAQVRQGQHQTRIIKWVPTNNTGTDNPGTTDSDPTERLRQPRLLPRLYGVFNAAQVQGWEPPTTRTHPPIAAAETWIKASQAHITYGHNQARYNPTRDRIEVPALHQYDNPIDHYSTVAHELIHWTGAPHRLRRNLTGRFGDDAYAAEELVAELGSAFTTARLGLQNEPRDDHAQYLSHWLRILKADPKALFVTATAAQKAVQHLADLAEPSESTN